MINPTNEYAVYAYEMGYAHAAQGIAPSATCDRYYAHGYAAFKA